MVRFMTADTWEKLEDYFNKMAECASSGAAAEEIDRAISDLGVARDSDYAEFVRRFGCAQVGSYPIYGFGTLEVMGHDFADVIALNRHFRQQRWPSLQKWLVFSFDLSGNPIGLDNAGRVWLCDHDHRQIVCIEPSFEAFLRSWCLELDSSSSQYLDQEQWPASPG
jgi:SMI1 / KNR4 family (SUKH-1)